MTSSQPGPVEIRGRQVLEVIWLAAREILDSRGHPTLEVEIELFGGARGRAGVPAGASKGSMEARELRDNDTSRYAGQGVQLAARNVMGEIAQLLRGHKFANLAELDEALIHLDGTLRKERIGANAIVGVSMAAARALSVAEGTSLWNSLVPEGVTPRMPVPHFNVINGGAHAANALELQEFMLAPMGAPNFADAVRAGAEIYAVLRGELASQHLGIGLGDEGGFAPEISTSESVLRILVAAIDEAGYRAGTDGIMIALDAAANSFHREGRYHLDGGSLSTDEMIEWYSELVTRFPIWSLEDGLAEDDHAGWERLTARLGDRLQIVGDDLLVTNPTIITEAIDRSLANAALIKPNQSGTVTETLEAMRICREAGWPQMVSHRSGETDDSFIADLAVASGCGQIKSGAPARGERVAKYNRLVQIEAEARLPYGLAE
jgi:enolase 1/2/3